jgi:hypothetical protein
MNKSPFSFQPPSKFNPSKFNNKDMLFNKKKISSDVLSMSSSSSSYASSSSGTSEEEYNSNRSNKYQNEVKYNNESHIDESSDDTDSDASSEDDAKSYAESSPSDDGNREESATKYAELKRDKKSLMMSEINEKREILYQMDRLESKGYRLPFKFDMESDINAMRTEYNKLIKEKEVDASIRFQRKMLMAFVTGTEYMNTRYDPFAVKLDGWSEQVHDTITDYDDIFEELHAKYKSTGKKMSPELRLFISLSGSAFMFHLTNRMFKDSPLPNVENVLKSNPELMKQFQAAAAKQYINGVPNDGQSNGSNGGNGGLFGMVSSLFNNMGGGPSRPSYQSRRDDDEMSNSSLSRVYRKQSQSNSHSQRPANDINNIINNVHSKISLEPDHNNIETLSISDEEITSIIEDTADIKILRNNKNKNSRTLNL